MIMRSAMGLLLGAAAIAVVPSAASAQDYYARERVPNLRPVVDPANSFRWATGQWSNWSSQCSDAAVRTRSVSCVNGNQEPVPDASCTAARPASSETQAIHTNCVTYTWRTGEWSQWSSQCSDAATRTRQVSCFGSDLQTAPDSSCTEPRPAASETQSIRSGCVTYNWQAGAWSDWSSHCSEEAERTRTVSCMGSDGSTGTESQCTANTKPETSQTAAVLDQCPPPKPACAPGVVSIEPRSDRTYYGGDGILVSPAGVGPNGKGVWVISNTREETRKIGFHNLSESWHITFTAPSYSDIYVMSDLGPELHRMDVYYTFRDDVQRSNVSAKASTTPWTGCE